MSYVISFLSGKGGVTKSTQARATAVKFRKDDWEVGVLDIDLAQATFRKWNNRRQNHGFLPAMPVTAGTLRDLEGMKESGQYHLIIVDGAAYGSLDAVLAAEKSDLVVVGTRFSLDDMDSAVETINNLVLKGIPKERFCIVFSGVPEQRNDRNYEQAYEYLSQTGYHIVPGYIEMKNSVTYAHNVGQAMNEVQSPSLRAKIDAVLDGIVAHLETVTSK
ncbi:ParA family protein [Salmonella enterica subsp. enterica serovar Bareilly]